MNITFSTNESQVPVATSRHSSHTNIPIITVAVAGIVATSFLLVGYYVFVIKCCLNWHRRWTAGDPLMIESSPAERCGLDEAAIRSIPVLVFDDKLDRTNCSECAICLSKFLHGEKLRAIPNCSHMFHIDCIDLWLQNNANCPLCRTSISGTSTTTVPEINPILLPTTPSCQDPIPEIPESFRDEDYIVIEIGSNHRPTNQLGSIIRPLPEKGKRSGSMGDEWADNRQKDEQFAVQPTMIRRSLSMDLALDTRVQEIVNKVSNEHGSNEGCSS